MIIKVLFIIDVQILVLLFSWTWFIITLTLHLCYTLAHCKRIKMYLRRFSERLKQLRLQNGQYQKELAIHLHISVGAISSCENGIHQPNLNTIVRIADFYGVTADYLLGHTDCPCSVDDINQVIAGKFFIGRLMQLLTVLPEAEKKFLAHILYVLIQTAAVYSLVIRNGCGHT